MTSDELRKAVNVSIALGKPLLIRGEPGTGKTRLAHSIAKGLEKKLIVWNIKSTTKAQEGLYVYDTVQRLNDSRFGDKNVSDIKQYIKLGKLGQAFTAPEQVVLLIDEVDNADIEFPNDLLNEIDEMSFYIPETNETITALCRPITIITSNAEKELPDAFLRRCIFHFIEFPTPQLMEKIVEVHFPNLKSNLLKEAMKSFYGIICGMSHGRKYGRERASRGLVSTTGYKVWPTDTARASVKLLQAPPAAHKPATTQSVVDWLVD